MRFSQDRLRELLLLTGFCGFFFFFRLSGIGLLGPDEPRYAQVAREMLARHDWVTPVLYGHAWLEKPVLLYWGEMLSYTLFGVSDWAARIPSAVAATLLVFGTFFTVRRIRFAARLDAAIVIASSVLVLGFARAAATDMLLAAPFGLSLLAWFCWYQSCWEPQVAQVSPPLAHVGAERNVPPSAARLWLVLFYALNALAMLAKGPVASALAALVLIAFCTSQRNWRALLRSLDPIGLAVFFAVAAPWYVLVQLRTPEFFRVFFLEHNLARFGSNLYRHKQPIWYYIPVALVATLPWTVWLFHGLGDAFRALRAPAPAHRAASSAAHPSAPGGSDTPRAPGYTFEIFLALWALVPIVFFSLSRSKLPGYILPSVPALLILAAVAVHRRAARGERPRWTSIAVHAVLLAALAAALCIAPRLILKLPASAQSLMIGAFVGTAVFLIVALPLLIIGWPTWRFVTLLPLILGVGFVVRGVAPELDATQSARPVAELLQQIEQPGRLPLATFALNRNTAFGLAFYLNRRVAPYEGLEISPTVYELPAAIPASAHILVTRENSLLALRLLLGNRTLRFIGSYRPQRIEIYEVSPAP
ncbi:MAG: glycosyltransferase family 39 protein [Candidatus Korobacteraceae bacterium]|jgi:4-amino-4-deoxy-L-arabinose transferase-like glycosyltransferase